MADYKGIKGFTVQSLATDPLTGGVAGATWSSGGVLNTARYGMAGIGIQTAALGVGGTEPPSTRGALNEEYNGTAWTEKGDLNSGRTNLAASQRGTITAGLVFGGATSGGEVALSESWNGSAWTATPALNTAAYRNAGAGTSTAALSYGGTIPPTTANTELWNGSSWSEVNDLNQVRQALAGGGTSTSALASGGAGNPVSTIYANVETWNGTSWTETTNINTARYDIGGNTASSTDGLVYGGNTGSVSALTEAWNGSTWTEVADLAVARGMLGSAGANSSSGLAFGGTPATTATEEFTAATITDTIKNEGQVYYNTTTNLLKLTGVVYGTGAWASGGNLNTSTRAIAYSAGTQTAAIVAGGASPPTSDVELYNGTSWTETTNLPTALYIGTGIGIQTSMIAVGGQAPITGATTKWDGSSWTELNDLNTARAGLGGAGTSTLALGIAGQNPAVSPSPGYGRISVVEAWDGSSWTETTNINEARTVGGSSGTQTAALMFGGSPGVSPYNTAKTESWNGSAWTEVNDLNTTRYYGTSSGTQTNALMAGGASPTRVANTEIWNGTSWTEVADLAQARGDLAQGTVGTSNSTLAISGEIPPYTALTEEWTVPETVSNVTVASS